MKYAPHTGDFTDRDGVVAAQTMLSALSAMHYGACRLHHDHDLDWKPMGEVVNHLRDAALILMDEYPTIDDPYGAFNREWWRMTRRAEMGIFEEME